MFKNGDQMPAYGNEKPVAQVVQELQQEKSTLENRLTVISKAIEHLQELCTHEWVSDDGHGYGVGTYTCSICQMNSEQLYKDKVQGNHQSAVHNVMQLNAVGDL